jgi:hypothetical protein
MMHSSVVTEPPHFRGGSSWNKSIVQLRKTRNWGDSSLALWSKSNGWATAGDRGIGIEQSGNTSSNFPAKDHEPIINFYREIESRVAHLPGVVAEGLVSALPLTGEVGWGQINVEGGTRQGRCVELGFATRHRASAGWTCYCCVFFWNWASAS